MKRAPMIAGAAIALTLALFGFLFLSNDEEVPELAPRNIRSDALAVHDVASDGRVLEAMDAVDHAFDQDLVPRAAALLESEVLPVAASHVEELEAVRVRSPEGVEYRRRGVALLQRRETALTRYHSVLSNATSVTGETDPMALIEALEEKRQVELALAELLLELELVIDPASAEDETSEAEAPSDR